MNTQTWRLASLYFFFLASLGILAPYWSLYLQSIGFTPKEIGWFTAALMGTKLIAPNIWGYIADRSGQHLKVVRIGAVMTALVYMLVFTTQNFWPLLAIVVGFSVFWNAILPQFEVITLNHLAKTPERYGQVRSWGSIGFVIAVISMGWLVEWKSEALIPVCVSCALWCVVVAAFSFRMPVQAPEKTSLTSFVAQLRDKQVMLFFAICFVMQLSHGPYYTFYSIYLEHYGFSKSTIGLLWALGVVAEIIMFLFMPRLIGRFGISKLLSVSILITALRWAVVASFGSSLSWHIFAQCLHAASYGMFHAAAIAFLHQRFSQGTHGQGQALYSSMSFGLGGALGGLLSGYAWQLLGGGQTFLAAAVVALIGVGLAAFLKDRL